MSNIITSKSIVGLHTFDDLRKYSKSTGLKKIINNNGRLDNDVDLIGLAKRVYNDLETMDTEKLNLYFHILNHTDESVNLGFFYGEKLGLNKEDMTILITGLTIHDWFYKFEDLFYGNEAALIDWCGENLHNYGYKPNQIDRVQKMIDSSKMRGPDFYNLAQVPHDRNDITNRLMCDIDTDNFGTKEFFENGKLNRKELKYHGKDLTNLEWKKFVFGILDNHNYHTNIAYLLRNNTKQINHRKAKENLNNELYFQKNKNVA